MENSKWVATVASIWIQCSCGASYAFGIYSAALKSSQGYDQSTLDTVSVFKDIGANIGVLAGLLYHAVTNNHRNSTPSSSRFKCGLPIVYLFGVAQTSVLLRLHPYVVVHHRTHSQTERSAHVHLHVHGVTRSDFLQYRKYRRRRQEFSRLRWNNHRHYEGNSYNYQSGSAFLLTGMFTVCSDQSVFRLILHSDDR